MVRVPVGSTRAHLATRRATASLVPALLVVLLLVAAVPTTGAAGARLSDPQPFSGELRIPADGAPDDQFLLFSGRLQMDGALSGPVFGIQSHAGSAIGAETLRVYRTDDPVAFAQQTPALEVANGTLVPDEAAAYLWSLPTGTVSASPAYTFAFLFNIENNLPDMGALIPPRDGPAPPSLIAQATDAPWSFSAPGAERSLYYPLRGGFTITAANGTTQHFESGDWLVSLRGETQAHLQAAGMAVPFETGSEARLGPATPEAFAAGFSVPRLQAFVQMAAELAEGFDPPAGLPDEGSDADCLKDLRACAANRTAAKEAMDEDGLTAANTTDDNATAPPADPPRQRSAAPDLLPAEALGALESLAPLLNGAFVGVTDATLHTGGSVGLSAGFSMVRYSSLTLAAQDAETVSYGGQAPLLFTDGHVQHESSVIRAGPIIIPILSAFLYLIAIGAYAATRVQTFRPLDNELTHKLWVPAMISQWALLLVAFLLFDAEVRYVLGESFLGSLGLYGGGSTAAASMATGTMALSGPALILVVQMVLWGSASLAFGLPIMIIVRSGLKAAGLGKPTYGFAFGAGALATWLLGTAMILPVLDVVFGSIASAA